MVNDGAADAGAPVLETARLRLRAHRVDDHAALCAIWGDHAVVRFIGGVPSTPHESWLRLLRYAGLWKLLGYGFWAIEEKAGGRMIGDIGYMDVKRGLTPTLDGMPEIGWALASAAHGRGYASEALAAVLSGVTPISARIARPASSLPRMRRRSGSPPGRVSISRTQRRITTTLCRFFSGMSDKGNRTWNSR